MRKAKPPYTGFGVEELQAFIASIRQQNYSVRTVTLRQQAVVDLLVYLNGTGCDRLADVQLSDLESYRGHIFERGCTVNSVSGYLWSIRRFSGGRAVYLF